MVGYPYLGTKAAKMFFFSKLFFFVWKLLQIRFQQAENLVSMVIFNWFMNLFPYLAFWAHCASIIIDHHHRHRSFHQPSSSSITIIANHRSPSVPHRVVSHCAPSCHIVAHYHHHHHHWSSPSIIIDHHHHHWWSFHDRVTSCSIISYCVTIVSHRVTIVSHRSCLIVSCHIMSHLVTSYRVTPYHIDRVSSLYIVSHRVVHIVSHRVTIVSQHRFS